MHASLAAHVARTAPPLRTLGAEPLVAYQPIASRTADGAWTVTGVEALVRPPVGDPAASTAEYLARLANDGLMNELFRHVLDAGLAQLALWDSAGVQLRLAVNLHVQGVSDDSIAIVVADLLRRHRIPGHRLLLEVGESAPIDDLAGADLVLSALRSLGVRVAIDDFGAGLASLTRVDLIACDELKIDRSLVTGADTSAELRRAVANAIAHGHARCMKVCAEGVETPSTLELLADLGCDRVQGWLIGPAVTGEELLPLAFAWDSGIRC